MYAKPISREVSYIFRAQSQFHERCLSLNIGTDRPLSRNTFDDLLEELLARILRLALSLLRIIAVLADHHHSIHRQLASAHVKASAIVG